MGDIARGDGRAWPWWLLGMVPVVGAAVAVVAHRVTYQDELGRYAGAEPALTGALVAAPFVALALAEAGCVAAAWSATRRRLRIVWAAAALGLGAIGILGLTLGT